MKPNVAVIRHQFNELMEAQRNAGEKLVDLLSHPQVCEIKDEIWEVCAMKARTRELLCGLIPKLRKLYPPSLSMALPWNTKEFDKYDQQVR